MSEVLLADLREWAESYDAVEIGADGVLYMAIHRIEKLIERNSELELALLEADQFITNGIELGYIRMPDADVPDAAHHIPGNIRAALTGEKKDG